jgi:CheY-like chemotaxis protein
MAKLDRRARLVYFDAGKAWICTNMAGSGERSSTSFLDGGGTMGALMRAHDWTKSPLGVAKWRRRLLSRDSIDDNPLKRADDAADISQSSWRVLLAEDEFLIAEDLASALSAAGATVIGPAYSVAGALGLIETCGALDGAVLDVNLKGEAAFPVADALLGRGVPFVFTTGYDRQYLKGHYEDIVRFEKPVDPAL